MEGQLTMQQLQEQVAKLSAKVALQVIWVEQGNIKQCWRWRPAAATFLLYHLAPAAILKAAKLDKLCSGATLMSAAEVVKVEKVINNAIFSRAAGGEEQRWCNAKKVQWWESSSSAGPHTDSPIAHWAGLQQGAELLDTVSPCLQQRLGRSQREHRGRRGEIQWVG